MDNEDYNEGIGYFDEDGNVNFKRENSATTGRYHSDWCSMIYSRLMLARNLLTEDGVIFISINDYEIENLRNVCNEVFGRTNLIANLCWRTDGNFDNQARIKVCHEYILVYAKNENKVLHPPVIDPNISDSSKLKKDIIRNTIVKNGPKNPISDVIIPEGFPCDFENGVIDVSSINFPQYSTNIICENYKLKNSVIATSGWAAKSQLLEFISNGFNYVIDTKGQQSTFTISKTGAIECIKKRSDFQSHVISVLTNLGGTQKATAELDELGSFGKFFDYPKPVILLKYLVSMFVSKNDVVLDFFSGSATTAHAVMQLNAEDGGKRKYIMVQVPEKTSEDSEAYKAGYKNICEIGKERLRRAGAKIKAELSEKGLLIRDLQTKNSSAHWTDTDEYKNGNRMIADDLDIGFRVLKLDETNMKDIYYTPAETTQTTIAGVISNIKNDRNDLDLLFGCLLDWGLPLSMPYSSEQIEGVTVHTYNDGDLIACFDKNISESVIKTIAKRQPLRVVFRDDSFADSPSKINVSEIFKMLSPDTRVKVI
ncbi:adenine-specific DNA-methyltransferase [Ruminococcus albus]|uniref:Adenine-specific DNA-methyltransferase n=2 Tax=Ruminococcus albus TaxID=1264 RepID=A0A1H7P9X0_RUMAL|nr:adenine-specific DNA-methyltransferase [Ruminococcus albus]